ncbi:YxeA family protein [Paenibacillus donghaensis]|uniref:YxeA family protein n=1 Tax=Paenibacillus donghaensis TaxID=414771 RepID=UPI0018845ACE|nr:YxeA family protein [Paenibacillus donghaensis]MBE9916936.1 YxeA family protein [Paenibacillus donghaensis]
MKKTLALFALVVVILTCLWLFFMDPDKLTPDNPAGKTTYYAIVNAEPGGKDSNGRYDYELTGYTDRGKSKKLTFSTGKKLQNGAFLKLYSTYLRGVTYWEEVRPEQLPEGIKKLISK